MSTAYVHRHHGRAGFIGQESDPRLELLDSAIGRAAPLREKHQVPTRLQELAGAVQLSLRTTGARERKCVQEESHYVAEQRPLIPIVGGCGNDSAISRAVRKRVQD